MASTRRQPATPSPLGAAHDLTTQQLASLEHAAVWLAVIVVAIHTRTHSTRYLGSSGRSRRIKAGLRMGCAWWCESATGLRVAAWELAPKLACVGLSDNATPPLPENAVGHA